MVTAVTFFLRIPLTGGFELVDEFVHELVV